MLRSQLELERSTFISHWRDIADYFQPRRARFSLTEANRGDRRNQKILDSSPSHASRTLAAGMMGGITSPAREWFRLTTTDPDLSELGSVKYWLHIVAKRMNSVFIRSNLYNVLPNIYADIGNFGTAALHVEEDDDKVVRFFDHPIGSYYIANDDQLRVTTFMRDFRMTVDNVIEKFGRKSDGEIDWTNISERVKNLYLNNNLLAWVDICHVVMKNDEYDNSKIESRFKKYISYYYERGTTSSNQSSYLSDLEDKFLSIKGYDFFPVLVVRWQKTGEDVYGTNCPGMEALGDAKQLMLGQRRLMQAVEKMINPPMIAPIHLKNQKSSILSGDITYADERDGQKGFRPAHEVNFNLQAMQSVQQDVRERINETFYKNLFLMLDQLDRSQRTATEINERKQEKLLVLGPVLEQLNQDLLDPLIDVTFNIMMKNGLIPFPPQEIHGQPLKVEYLSILAQAQKSAMLSSVERFAGFVGNIAGGNPSVLDKVDMDEIIDVYGDMIGVPPSIVKSNEEVQMLRERRAQEQFKQKQLEALPALAKGAKDLSETPIDESSAFGQLIARSNAGSLQ